MIFSVESIRAIRAKKKTQTRRVIEPQPTNPQINSTCEYWNSDGDHGFWWSHDYGPEVQENDPIGEMFRCPHGKAGDGLWVREPTRRTRDGFTQYTVDDIVVQVPWPDTARKTYRLARWMPRVLCRLELVIVRVRVERLQSITDDDARAEGAEPAPNAPEGRRHIQTFIPAWDALNAARGFGWNANPWVFAINFQEANDGRL